MNWKSAHHCILTCRTFITCGTDGKIIVHDTETKKIVKEIKHEGGVNAICVSPIATKLVSGGVDHRCQVYTWPEGTFETTLVQMTQPVRCVAFAPNGNYVALGGGDQLVKIVSVLDPLNINVLKVGPC